MSDPLRNPKDPLHKTGPEAEKELFRRLVEAANGFSREQVIGATLNVLVNAIRQSAPNRATAEAKFDELFGKTKQILLDHYDGTGARKNIFPFHQVIQMPLFDMRDKR